ncbi:Nn.00g106710.m01.CDS01 [Neocucurbitaria sp. VM-36]
MGVKGKANVLLFGGVEVDISQFDFDDHSSRVDSIKTTNILLIVLVMSIVSLRIFSRAVFVRNIFADDVFILLAAAFTVALAATCISATRYGLGTHVWLLPVSTIIQTMKNCILHLYICQVLYACAIALTKIAIISSYLRFIQDRTFRISMYVISAVIAGLWVTGVFVTIFQCSPVEGAWDFTISPRTCINYVNYLYASSAVNIATDILLCVLPLPHLWRLKMPLKQRIILCILFAGGASACVVCIVRIGYLHHLRNMDTTSQKMFRQSFLLLTKLRPKRTRPSPDRLRMQPRHHMYQHTGPSSNGTTDIPNRSANKHIVQSSVTKRSSQPYDAATGQIHV